MDLPALRQAIDAYRKGRVSEGDRLRDGVKDPAARALLEWVAIRAGAGIGFERTVAFTRSNPDWPAGPLLRRRAGDAIALYANPAYAKQVLGWEAKTPLEELAAMMVAPRKPLTSSRIFLAPMPLSVASSRRAVR